MKTMYIFRSFSLNMTNERIYTYVNMKKNSATTRAAGRQGERATRSWRVQLVHAPLGCS